MTPFAVYLLCAIAGVVVFYLPGRIFKSKPTTDQVISRQAAAKQPKTPYAGKYPHGVVRPAVDDLTGASIMEVDVKDWAYVRKMELECLGAYYHRLDGTTEACGWEAIEEAIVAVPHPTRRPPTVYVQQDGQTVTARAGAMQANFWARKFVHGDDQEARAWLEAEVAAEVGRMSGVHVQLDRADAPYEVRPVDYREQVGPPPWVDVIHYHSE